MYGMCHVILNSFETAWEPVNQKQLLKLACHGTVPEEHFGLVSACRSVMNAQVSLADLPLFPGHDFGAKQIAQGY